MDLRVVEKEANRPVGGRLQFFRHNLEADLQRLMDLGDNIGEQMGVFRMPPSEKGANTGTFEQGKVPGSRWGAIKDGSQTSNQACRRQLARNIC